jgi:hypothetical protein
VRIEEELEEKKPGGFGCVFAQTIHATDATPNHRPAFPSRASSFFLVWEDRHLGLVNCFVCSAAGAVKKIIRRRPRRSYFLAGGWMFEKIILVLGS